MAGNPHPVFQNGVPVDKANARTYLPLRLGNQDALRALDGSTFWLCYIQTLLSFFYRDTSDTTSEDNGSSVIVDGNGGIWKVISSGAGIAINAAGPVASRGSFDSEDPGFTYFGTDTELLYVRETAGGWSDGTEITGPQGEPGDNGADGRNFQPDEVVPDISGRDAYDGEAKNFAVLVESDSSNDDLPTLYFKLSATSGDWSAGSTFGSGGGDVAGDTHAATSKTTPVDADELPLVDSEASNVLKKLTWANLKAALAAWLVSAGWIRERLTANLTIYADNTNGNDSNDGRASGSGHALKTIQAAVDAAALLDSAGKTVTIQLADGTYTGAVNLKNVVGFAAAGNLVIQGNNTTPANVLVSVNSSYAFLADSISSVWDIKDLKIQNSGGYGIGAFAGAKVRFGNLNFGSCGSFAHTQPSGPGSIITALSNYAVSGGATANYEVTYGAQFVSNGLTVTVTGTPAFSLAWAFLSGAGASAKVHGMTFSGSATGSRYSVNNGAELFTNGAGTTYLPGNAVGSGTNYGTSPYGQYV